MNTYSFWFTEKTKSYIQDLEDRLKDKLKPSSNTQINCEDPASGTTLNPKDWWNLQWNEKHKKKDEDDVRIDRYKCFSQMKTKVKFYDVAKI